MQVTSIKVQSGEIVRISGEINLDTSPDLRKACIELLDKGEKDIVVSLKEVSYLDSAGLATLIELLQKIKGKGGTLKLCGLSDSVRTVFELNKLDTIFSLFPSEEDALKQ